MSIAVCPYCRSIINDNDDFIICPECEVKYHVSCWIKNNGCFTNGCKENTGGYSKNIVQIEEVKPVEQAGRALPRREKTKTNRRTLWIVLASILGALIVAGGLFAGWYVFIRNKPISKIELSQSSMTLTEGDSSRIAYTILPDNSEEEKLTWTSSNTSVATVSSQGVVKAVAKGECEIKVNAQSGVSATCKVIVEQGPVDFKELYKAYCKSSWATVGSDGSYLSIDTNPYDINDYMDEDAFTAVQRVNTALGLPEYVYETMLHTNSLQGRQEETFDDIGVSVTWTYHPNNGLQVTYKRK